MADARKDKRTLLSMKIRYKSATLEDFIERYSNDISRGGVFIKAKKPLAVGTLLKFEFMLQDQSTLIHGVGRVVWRREESEADDHNPAGMGIKFIKMDPESRSVVQRIAEGRAHPGVFEQGKEGTHVAPANASDPGDLDGEDRTQVRHVSEFLASALEEGRAGQAATREARAGAERARKVNPPIGTTRAAAARGAFSAHVDGPGQKRSSASPGLSRGAKSAFGATARTAGSVSSSAAPSMEELDAEEDFLDSETTRIQEYPKSDFPDVAATVVAKEGSPFAAERRQTPVVPMASASRSPLEDAVPDLFGPSLSDSFGPAPGEFIDASLLDPAVPTVPPPGRAVPAAPGVPAEALRVAPRSARPVESKPSKTRGTQPWLVVPLVALLIGAAGFAAWQLGLARDWIDRAAPYLGLGEEPAREPSERPMRLPTPPARPEMERSEAQPAEIVAPEAVPEQAEPTQGAEQVAATAAVVASPATGASMAKVQVLSVPSGAFVSVDGKNAGRTPLELEYAAGTSISLLLRARGYSPRKQQLTVQATQSPVKLVLAPLPYVVHVVTAPAGARATAVGGGEVTTPGDLRFKSIPGTRQIVISKEGYKTVTRPVALSGFAEEGGRMATTISITLEKEPALQPAQAVPDAETAGPTPTPVEPPTAAEERAEPPVEPEAAEDAPAATETSEVEAP
jgi:uncharacterized protein (TIGR02266 family)